MKKLLTTAMLAATCATTAWSAPQSYAIDSEHTFARFSYSHHGLSTQVLRFDHTQGTVVLDAAAQSASVDVSIDTQSVSTGSDAFDKHIQAPTFLDTAQFPSATFKSTRVVFKGERPSQIEGNLTIKGVTKPVTFTINNFAAKNHPLQKKPAIGADAVATIKRSDFNAGAFAPAVSDEVTLSISLEAIAP
jgi:polyisoprenoid-binding protein YceI